jgi:hypothetical protein
MFVQQNDPYFKTNGFFERSIVKRVGLRGLLSRRYLVAAKMAEGYGAPSERALPNEGTRV